jgi:ribonuclease R
VQQILEEEHEASEQDYNAPGDVLVPIEDHVPTTTFAPGTDERKLLLILNRMAKELRRKRFQSGAVDFDRCEVRFNVDEKASQPVSISRLPKMPTNSLRSLCYWLTAQLLRVLAKYPKTKRPRLSHIVSMTFPTLQN